MARMHIYTVHINPRKKYPYENPIFVKEGFCWSGFIFGPLWSLYHHLWIVSICLILLIALIFLSFAAIIISPLGYYLLRFILALFIGLEGNDWRRNKLRKQGYIISDIVTGSDLVGAEQRYFERYYPHGRLPQTPPHNPPSTPGSKQGLPLPA